jgi:predicted O-methyltransferase YrrM
MNTAQHKGPKMELSGVAIFQQVITAAEAAPDAVIKYQIAPAQVSALKMANHFHPLSITPGEFEFLRDFIAAHDLQHGYECATAFGVSALAAAFGMRQTGGKLLTIDAYIEEKHNLSTAYQNFKEVNQNDPDGLKSLHWLLSQFDLSRFVDAAIGWSPDNVAEAIVAAHGSAMIDYAFIDAGHWDEALLNDAQALRPFVDTAQPFAVFFHDIPCFSPGLWDVLAQSYGHRMQPITSIAETWAMGVISNIPLIEA